MTGQCSSRSSTKRHGMGVGLSISHTIIEAHGGQICRSDANPGGGTVSVHRNGVDEDIGDAAV